MIEEYILIYGEYMGESLLGCYDDETFEGTKEQVLQKFNEMKKENQEYENSDEYYHNSPFNHHPYINIEIYKKITEEYLNKTEGAVAKSS